MGAEDGLMGDSEAKFTMGGVGIDNGCVVAGVTIIDSGWVMTGESGTWIRFDCGCVANDESRCILISRCISCGPSESEE